MNTTFLLIATILTWIAVIAKLYQRFFEMSKRFENPPSSVELIRKQDKRARAFWLPLSALIVIFLIGALILNRKSVGVRIHIFGALVCFGLAGVLNGIYFVKEIIAFTKIPVDAPQTPELLRRTRLWLKWTIVRDVLQVFAALFVTIAYRHA
ncbi:MAG: hypothetical protein JWQ09_2946 [Segetibacter sp.]|nr:hypothetical protein [Segetibacter sp.]